MEILENSSEG